MNAWLRDMVWRRWQGGDRVGRSMRFAGIGRAVLAWSVAAILAAPTGALAREPAGGQGLDWPWAMGGQPQYGPFERDRHAECQSAAGHRNVLFQSGGILVDAPYPVLVRLTEEFWAVCLNGMPLPIPPDESLALTGYVRAGSDHVFLFNYNDGEPCARLFHLIVFNAHRRPAIFNGGPIGRCAADVTMQVVDYHRDGAPRAASSVEFHFANFHGQGEGEWRRVWRYVDGRLELLSTLPRAPPRRHPR